MKRKKYGSPCVFVEVDNAIYYIPHFHHLVHREIFKFCWCFCNNPFWSCCFVFHNRSQHDIYMPFHVFFFCNVSSSHSPWNISTIDSLIWGVCLSLYYERTLLWFHHHVKDHIFCCNICFILLWITAVIYDSSAFYFCNCFEEPYICLRKFLMFVFNVIYLKSLLGILYWVL